MPEIPEKLIQIVSVDAPSMAEPEKSYKSTVTIKNNATFPLVFRYKYTITYEDGTIWSPRFLPPPVGTIRAGETKEILLETIAKTEGVEKHLFIIYVATREQDRAEWDVTVTKVVPIGAMIVKAMFSEI